MELSFKDNNGHIDALIANLMMISGGIERPEIVRDLILSSLKAGQEDDGRNDLKLMNSTLKELRYTAKVFGQYRERRKVAVFGSARTAPDEAVYRMAVDFGRRLAEDGYMAITGGGPGIMQAVNEGAGAENSFGINIRLPFEQRSNPVIDGNPRNITYKYFFNRKVAFLKESDAVAVFPGGFGTQDEAMEALTLTQTGKRNPMPLILIDQPGGTYWGNWLAFVKAELLGSGCISESDLNLFAITDQVDIALHIIRQFYHRYHSLRYVGEQLSIRMQTELAPPEIATLRTAYADILHPSGDIRPSKCLPLEKEGTAIDALPRLIVDFNRRDFGRLKMLIDDINRAP